MLGEIGTLAWTRRTNGLLKRPERVRYVAAAVREQARAAAPLLAFRLGRGARRQAVIDEDGLRIPDSQVARDAVQACVGVQPRSIIEHNYRSFIFARALGSLAGVSHDEELLFVATMFHDAGALEPDRTDGGRCFTLKGAADAESHLTAAGWSADRCAAAAKATSASAPGSFAGTRLSASARATRGCASRRREAACWPSKLARSRPAGRQPPWAPVSASRSNSARGRTDGEGRPPGKRGRVS